VEQSPWETNSRLVVENIPLSWSLKCITVFTISYHRSLSNPPSHPISLRSVLVISSHHAKFQLVSSVQVFWLHFFFVSPEVPGPNLGRINWGFRGFTQHGDFGIVGALPSTVFMSLSCGELWRGSRRQAHRADCRTVLQVEWEACVVAS
jgi:hypothetical protein